jgi:GNAT superfamily N-acetyltransferase
MDTTDILRLYDQQERINGSHPSYRREAAEGVVRAVSHEPDRLSFIIYSDLTADNADRIIQEQIAWYHREVNGPGLEWKYYRHDRPPDLPQRLVAHGFTPDDQEGLLVLDLVDDPPEYLQTLSAAESGIDVRCIADPDQLRQVAAIQAAVYNENFDWLEKQLRENVRAEPDYWAIYIAYIDEMPACAAWASFPAGSQFAGLWGGATRPEYRKKGLYTAVVAARAQEALRRGYRFLTVDASDMSRPILEKRGFRLLTHTTPFTWTK